MHSSEPDGVVRWAAGASIAAGLLHGLNIEEHLNEWWGYGLFFLLAAAGQLIYGLLLLVRPWEYDETGARRAGGSFARRVYIGGIAANCFFVALYLVTRTSGIPVLGPAAGKVEAVTPVGLLTKAAELALVALLVLKLRRHPRPENRGPATR